MHFGNIMQMDCFSGLLITFKNGIGKREKGIGNCFGIL